MKIEPNQRFGRLVTVSVSVSQRYGQKNSFWLCKCDCGNMSEVWQTSLRTGTTKSCGCWHREAAGLRTKTHGMSNSKAYGVWRSMLKRCHSPSYCGYHRYGGRGIKVCDRWLKFENFWEDMKASYAEGLSLDRINNDGNYEPLNCRWADAKTQMRNTCQNHLVTVRRVSKPIAEWSEITGIGFQTIRLRLLRGWSPEEAVFRKVSKR